MTGSRINIWKQAPQVSSIGIGTLYIPFVVQDGPCDEHIAIVHQTEAKADENGDFLFNPVSNPVEFYLAHTYGMIKKVLVFFELKRHYPQH